jgi:hypothetical protein
MVRHLAPIAQLDYNRLSMDLLHAIFVHLESFQIQLGKVIVCGVGTYSNSGINSTSCQKCLPGLYAFSEGSSICAQCDAGRFSSAQEYTHGAIKKKFAFLI